MWSRRDPHEAAHCGPEVDGLSLRRSGRRVKGIHDAGSVRVTVTADLGNQLLGTFGRQQTLRAEWLVAGLEQHVVQLLGLPERRRRATSAQGIWPDEHGHRDAVPGQRDLFTFADPIEQLWELARASLTLIRMPEKCTVLVHRCSIEFSFHRIAFTTRSRSGSSSRTGATNVATCSRRELGPIGQQRGKAAGPLDHRRPLLGLDPRAVRELAARRQVGQLGPRHAGGAGEVAELELPAERRRSRSVRSRGRGHARSPSTRAAPTAAAACAPPGPRSAAADHSAPGSAQLGIERGDPRPSRAEAKVSFGQVGDGFQAQDGHRRLRQGVVGGVGQPFVLAGREAVLVRDGADSTPPLLRATLDDVVDEKLGFALERPPDAWVRPAGAGQGAGDGGRPHQAARCDANARIASIQPASRCVDHS